MNLRLYGQPNWNFEYLKSNLFNVAKTSGIDLRIEEITDLDKIITESLDRIPSIKLENEIVLGKKEEESINAYLKTIQKAILKQEHYGNLQVLLVPIDFSKASEKAFMYALQLAEKINAVVRVVYVYHPSIGKQGQVIFNGKSVELEKRKELEDFMNHNTSFWIRESLGSPIIESSFEMGIPDEKILEISDSIKNAIIIMGTEDNTDQLAHKANLATLVQKATCPVLLVPAEMENFSFDHICYALDSIETDLGEAKFIAPIFKKLNAGVSLVHVSTHQDDYKWEPIIKLWRSIYPKNKLALYRYIHHNIEKGLEGFCTEHGANLLVMTARERGFLKSLFHQSHTKQMTIQTKIPLLILHQKNNHHET